MRRYLGKQLKLTREDEGVVVVKFKGPDSGGTALSSCIPKDGYIP